MVACDVGQGDATVLHVAKHSAIVIDAGGEATAVDRCLKALHVKQVPLLVLTHFHADHVGGIEGVLHRRSIGQVLVSPLKDPPMMQSYVQQVLRERGITSREMSFPGQVEVEGIVLRCLWPVRLLHGPGSAANNASVVLRTQIDGVTYLLTGDVEPPAQEALLESVGPVDVLKVPHHGSPYQSPQFAARVRPRIATISVGADNDYGHPAPATIAMYEAMGTTVLRTDLVGDIAVVWRDGRLVAVGRHT
jgi:competence protein ComEC